LCGFLHPAWAGLAVALLLVQAQPQSRAAEFRARFAREGDPIHRAKLMPQLGEAEFQDIQRQVAAGELSDALETAKEYRSQVQQCQKELDATGVDVEKHPSGFKELQISLRQSLRRLDETLVSFPADDQKPFLEVRKDLDRINRHLIRELFPRQPGAEEVPQKPKN
jgi:hypothetical protein